MNDADLRAYIRTAVNLRSVDEGHIAHDLPEAKTLPPMLPRLVTGSST